MEQIGFSSVFDMLLLLNAVDLIRPHEINLYICELFEILLVE